MTPDEMKQKLYELQSTLSAYGHALSLIGYDGDTSAPSGTAENRAHSVAILSGEAYRLSTCRETVELLQNLDSIKEQLSGREQRMVFLLLKDIRQKQKIPQEDYIAYQELLVRSGSVWHEAKQKSDFSLFRPYLEKIFEMCGKIAVWCAPDSDPYDYWLNEYEDGLTTEKCDAFFKALRDRLVPLIRRISEKEQVSRRCLDVRVSDQAQLKLSEELMTVLGLDREHVGLSTTEHPFTTSLGSHLDERITTHFYEDDFSSSMFSVIHEGGHALYDTGSDDELSYTVLDGGVCMSIHESQSRFYENLLGRSKAFIRFITPVLHRCFPATECYGAEDFYKALNRVEPGPIRVEADEVSYCLHVMIRYELEKAILSGSIQVSDLPKEWNRLYREYLGVDVSDDAHGILQDSHWSGGMIGYFPSYALGSAYGAQFLNIMKKEISVDACLEKGDFSLINAWNREHIWRFGRSLPCSELLKNILRNESFDPSFYLDYLEKKYTDIYHLD